MNLLLLDFTCPLADINPGTSGTPPSWMEWRGTCAICHCLILDGAGLFCASFCSPQGRWKACTQVWCSPSYRPLDKDEFPIVMPKDEDGLVSEEDLDW